VNLLGGYTSTVRHASRSVEIVFPARRQKSTSQSIEPPAIDGKALQCGSFLTLYSGESKAQCMSFQPRVEGAMHVFSTLVFSTLQPCLFNPSCRVLRAFHNGLAGPSALLCVPSCWLWTRRCSHSERFRRMIVNLLQRSVARLLVGLVVNEPVGW
jgi:hypothetical protein